MKYYSDKTKKFYDTEDECIKGEELFDSYKRQSSSLKKKLSKAVEDAETKLNESYDKYKEAKEEASKIVKEAEDKANAIINEAKEKINSAQKEKADALKNFNDKFGTYTVTYTGEDAVKEFNRASDWINTFFGWRW